MSEKEPLNLETVPLEKNVYSSFGAIYPEGDVKKEGHDQDTINNDSNLENHVWCNRWATVVGLVCVLLLMLVITIAVLGWSVVYTDEAPHNSTDISAHGTAKVLSVPEDELRRIDCYPETAWGVDLLTPEKCEGRGCVYLSSPNPGVPWCFVPQTDYGFAVVQGPVQTPLGERWLLRRKNVLGIYADNFENVTFDIEMREDNMLRFKLTTPDDPDRYHVPWLPAMSDTKTQNPTYSVSVYQQDPFSFRITRSATGSVIWDTGVGGLVFADQFLQIATALPTDNIYGFGENLHRSFKHDMNFRSWPIFPRDEPPHSGETKEVSLYSYHPFYECIEADGNTHGVLFWNSNSMDYTLTPYPMLVYKTVGGILDFYVFMGPSPENVIQQYTGAIGRPIIPPYYSLGFQLSRYGYRNTSDMRAARDRTQAYGIPLDLQYADIDHMDRQRSFTLDYENFTDLSNYVSELHAQGMRTVLILNPNIEIADDYETSVRGRDGDVFVEFESIDVMPPGDYDLYNNTYVMGTVWVEWIINFVDFYKPQTKAYWKEELRLLQELIPYDGIWLDMNEPANFDTNRDKAWNWPDDRLPYYTLKCPVNEWDDPPYRSKAAYVYDDSATNHSERLSYKTICMQSVQGGNQEYRHYDVHSLYGHQQIVVTHQALSELYSTRPMIISRSTVAGDGQYCGRWLGDNSATWLDLQYSVIGMMEFNLFGIPYIGADICGFFGNSTAQLCKRWHQLGAFYPYSRNHNHEEPLNQDPGYYGDEVAIATRDIMVERYRLLPYLYTLFYKSHTTGATVIRPLFHEFTSDNNTFGIDRQFLWGAALLVTPILEQDATWLSYYLPGGRWYNYWDGTFVMSGGTFMNESITSDSNPVLCIRGGHILPTQIPAATTTASRLNAFGLKIALDAVDGTASGELFWDDGESKDTSENGQYYFSTFDCSSSVLTMTVAHNNESSIQSLVMDTVSVYGVSAAGNVLVNDSPHTNFTFDLPTQVLEIGGLALSMVLDFSIAWTP